MSVKIAIPIFILATLQHLSNVCIYCHGSCDHEIEVVCYSTALPCCQHSGISKGQYTCMSLSSYTFNNWRFLTQVYSHRPCEKPLMERVFCWIGLRIFSDVTQEQLWLNALLNITNGICWGSNPWLRRFLKIDL